jgi:nucleoid-associated protein YgaU
VTYLHTLIDRNHAVFTVPGHPDLVFPGQVFTLPPP